VEFAAGVSIFKPSGDTWRLGKCDQKLSIFKPSEITWRLGKCDQIIGEKHFAA
jgi:hypothetical protein